MVILGSEEGWREGKRKHWLWKRKIVGRVDTRGMNATAGRGYWSGISRWEGKTQKTHFVLSYSNGTKHILYWFLKISYKP